MVEEYVSSLISKDFIASPASKKVDVKKDPQPRISGKSIPPINKFDRKNDKKDYNDNKFISKKEDEKRELSDQEIKKIFNNFGVTSSNFLDILSSDEQIRKELGLGDINKKNSEYYRRIYRLAAANEAN